MDVPGLLQLLAIGLIITWAMVALRIGWVLTHPPRRTLAFALAKGWPATPGDVPATWGGPREFAEWTLTWRGTHLPVWDVPCDRADGPVVIFTHGWGEARLHGLLRLGAWGPLASRVILWDLPGHGEAPGTCRLGADEHLALVELVMRVRAAHPHTPIVLHGFSLGAGVSIAAAAELTARGEPVYAVIAEAPYRVPQTPARAVLWHNGLTLPGARAAAQGVLGSAWGHGLSWFSAARAPRFDRAACAARLGPATELLVIHGERDDVCPVADGRAIAAAAPRGRCEVVPGAGHLDLWTDPDARQVCAGLVQGFIGAGTAKPG